MNMAMQPLYIYTYIYIVYLLTCKICEKQYVGSTVTKFRSRSSNINLYGKDQRGFIEIIDYCDPNNRERGEDFWIYHLNIIYPRGILILITV